MTSVETRDLSLNQHDITEIADSTHDLSLPTPLSPLMSLASLDRCISNPLVRGYSNVSVSSDNEGAHFVPYGRNHDEIANQNDTTIAPNINPTGFGLLEFPSFGFSPNLIGSGLNMMPSFLCDTDGINQITPIHVVKSKVMQHPSALGPLDDHDGDTTDCTSSQVASSDLPSIEGPTNDNININNNAVTFNAEAAEFVPNPNISVPPPRINTIPIGLPPLLQTLSILNPMNPMIPPNLLPLQQIQLNNLQQQLAMGHAPIINNNINNNNNNMIPTHINNRVQGSTMSEEQNKAQDYDAMVRNYMEATNGNEHNTATDTDDAAANQSPNSPDEAASYDNNNGGFRYQGAQRRPTKYVRAGKVANANNNKNKNIQNMDVTDLIKMNVTLPVLLKHNMICKFMKHQNGSRYIQERLKIASVEVNTLILKHIIFKQKQILSLSEDIFGNYVIQIFFENGTEEHHRLLTENLLYTNAYRLSRSFYGCRVIQKAFDCIPMQECKKIVKELEDEGRKSVENKDEDGVNLIHDAIICPNANHVIQKIITLKLNIKHIQFIIDCIDQNICFYSSHIFGCRIVQNIINYYGYNNDKRMLSEMVSKENLLHLCQSQYGNYVIQHILALSFDDDNCKEIKKKVVRNVFSNVMYLSKNKYGSNVVEKCLQKANDKERDYLLDQILNKQYKNVLAEMVKHKYANYVVQKLLTFCNAKQQQRLIYHIERSIPNLRTLNYGKHIMDKIKKIKQSFNNQKYQNY